MDGGDLLWASASQLTIRGGSKNRSTRVLPGHLGGMVAQLRDSNLRAHGAQPLVNTRSWRQQTSGSQNVMGDTRETERGQVSGWKATKRAPGWAKFGRSSGSARKVDARPVSDRGRNATSTMSSTTVVPGWVAISPLLPATQELESGKGGSS